MYLSLLSIICLFISTTIVLSEDKEEETNKIQSLCENAIINSADRLTNSTVRLYRGKYYWVLNGMPDPSGYLEGPFKISYPNMGSIYRNNTVVTLLGGTDRGSTFKTEGKYFWAWNQKGEQWSGGKDGTLHNRFPDGGFEALIHDGNTDNPMVIGFRGIKVYYFKTKFRLWAIDGSPSGHIGGKFNESFPPDLSAAFSWPADDPKDGYIAKDGFKRDKFCKRTKKLKTGDKCEWIDNQVLFGCSANSGGTQLPYASTGGGPSPPPPPGDGTQQPSIASSPLPIEPETGGGEAPTEAPVKKNSSVISNGSLVSILIAFYFVLKFH